MNKEYIAPWVRVLILLVSIFAILCLSRYFTGSVIPPDPRDALIFQNALLLEKYYTRPADSMVNSLMGIITLISVYRVTPALMWWFMFWYLTVVFLAAAITISIYSLEVQGQKLKRLAQILYQPAVILGQARILYSVLFLFAIFTYKSFQSQQAIALIMFWGLFIVIWPLRIPEALSKIVFSRAQHQPIGHVMRTDWPNIIRVTLDNKSEWIRTSPKIIQQVGGKQSIVIPLFFEPQGDQLVGTGIIVKDKNDHVPGLEAGNLYEPANLLIVTDSEISEALGGGVTSKLVGFIVEESTIAEIRFEIWDADVCWEGMLVWCKVGEKRVYYQITNGTTKEETFQSNRHGFQVGIAVQLGILEHQRGFIKHTWVPRMNTPIFGETEEFGQDINLISEGDFVYGTLPGTQLKVAGPFVENMDRHTAILGVTGAGKTELAFDIIRHSKQQGAKVICIDLTARYVDRLNDLKPRNLSLSADLLVSLSEKLFDAETGKFGAGEEKKALKQFSDKIRVDIITSIESFLKSDDEENKVGIIALQEISNTKATLYITELYLTCLLNYAKENLGHCPPILIVVEEAHTVMPEPNTMGLGDYDSRGLVGKIAQIALQGRKYRVGLVVIAQRTATVSKSVLTQCNTVISFTCFDDTSLGFLSNIYGSTHVSLIPNLPPLHAVIFGKGLRSQRPLIIQIPFDQTKADAT